VENNKDANKLTLPNLFIINSVTVYSMDLLKFGGPG